MDLGAVTVLELLHGAHGKRIACCLATGEFIVVTTEASQILNAPSPALLFGKNVGEFIDPYDSQRIGEILQVYGRNGIVPSEACSQIMLTVRVARSNVSLWVRFKTMSLTLRLLRCIDAVTLPSPIHHFSDSSSFIVSEEELGSMANEEAILTRSEEIRAEGYVEDDAAAHPNQVKQDVPLEPKEAQLSTSDSGSCIRSPSSTSDPLDQSLASLAFEADWADELLQQHQRHVVAPFPPPRTQRGGKFLPGLVM
ncbi:hypothetical protein Poli38472_006518 [Pythium oligandrum]|uniref:Uncharacterized protein n=1 Tax=Pythium oligandrum TaxID=41045 RepID=A0A8K1C4Z0_PYTOL|nr:hypothetical protein Poli38472_006518 [Pythium oligandrum]|eukprot:TMW56508.1 hypothetical protein Poli38472_006518 [Pythium oligandrum]